MNDQAHYVALVGGPLDGLSVIDTGDRIEVAYGTCRCTPTGVAIYERVLDAAAAYVNDQSETGAAG